MRSTLRRHCFCRPDGNRLTDIPLELKVVGVPEVTWHDEPTSVARLYEALLGGPVKVSHVPLGLPKEMVSVLRRLHPGISQILQPSIYDETGDWSFDPLPLPVASPVTLTHISEWAVQRFGQYAAVPNLDQALTIG